MSCNAENSNHNLILETIELEGKKIEACDKGNFAKLSEYYADRADSFLLTGYIAEAIEDFSTSHYYAEKLSDNYLTKALKFRSLFGNLFCYGIIGDESYITHLSTQLLELIYSSECSSCSDNKKPTAHISSFQQVKALFAKSDDVPIYGPEVISIQDCIDMVDNTSSFAKILILKSPANVRGTLNYILDQLTSAARRCCKAGGLWKACFQPLANKYHTWNQKWQVLGIPPDPAWD
ncbi:MAG: hypothetical protein FJZ57_00425 [Chlamydiae bacterium]|nr:hypothetical protein [Chlamydiota bacterium]